MTLRELESELESHGFTFARTNGAHRVYRNCTGQFVVVCLENGRPTFDKGHVREIRKQLRKQRATQDQQKVSA
jgi:predicted RNA binding protein YcfA (HicA-like mRNA interferase family)